MKHAAGSQYRTIDSPLGPLLFVGDGTVLAGLYMPGRDGAPQIGDDWVTAPNAFGDAVEQMREYFDGRRTHFDVKRAAVGTPFQHRVWDALCEIPFGETRSYADIAARIGKPSACRAVGLANGRNPIGIIVPCHRVIGKRGDLVGYAAGLENKRTLLDLEQRALVR